MESWPNLLATCNKFTEDNISNLHYDQVIFGAAPNKLWMIKKKKLSRVALGKNLDGRLPGKPHKPHKLIWKNERKKIAIGTMAKYLRIPAKKTTWMCPDNLHKLSLIQGTFRF